MGKMIRPFCWHQNVVPWGLSAPAPRLCTCIKSWKKCIKNQTSKTIVLKLATNKWSDKTFLLTSKLCPLGAVFPCPGLYTCIKSWKNCIKSDFNETFLKLATSDRSDKMFLLTSKFRPQGVVSPYPGAIYMYKIMKKMYKIRLQRCFLNL